MRSLMMPNWFVPAPMNDKLSKAKLGLQKSDDAHRQRCSGMYSRKAWGGDVDPFILVKFTKSESQESDPLASLVIFEWSDEGLIGQYRADDAEVCLSTPWKQYKQQTWLIIGVRSRKQSAMPPTLRQISVLKNSSALLFSLAMPPTPRKAPSFLKQST